MKELDHEILLTLLADAVDCDNRGRIFHVTSQSGERCIIDPSIAPGKSLSTDSAAVRAKILFDLARAAGIIVETVTMDKQTPCWRFVQPGDAEI